MVWYVAGWRVVLSGVLRLLMLCVFVFFCVLLRVFVCIFVALTNIVSRDHCREAMTTRSSQTTAQRATRSHLPATPSPRSLPSSVFEDPTRSMQLGVVAAALAVVAAAAAAVVAAAAAAAVVAAASTACCCCLLWLVPCHFSSTRVVSGIEGLLQLGLKWCGAG